MVNATALMSQRWLTASGCAEDWELCLAGFGVARGMDATSNFTPCRRPRGLWGSGLVSRAANIERVEDRCGAVGQVVRGRRGTGGG